MCHKPEPLLAARPFFLLNNKPFWKKNIITKERPLKRQQKQSTHYEKKKF